NAGALAPSSRAAALLSIQAKKTATIKKVFKTFTLTMTPVSAPPKPQSGSHGSRMAALYTIMGDGTRNKCFTTQSVSS
ncbi:MAG: hypothetical protein IK129_02190, partial [Deltaproteobacteria bacterium]|nr:hypothetical protein [Deltaproteobacteria bacterium]